MQKKREAPQLLIHTFTAPLQLSQAALISSGVRGVGVGVDVISSYLLIRVLVSSKIGNIIEDITSSITIDAVIGVAISSVIVSNIIVNSVIELVSAIGLYRVIIGKAIILLAITLV